MAIEKTLSTKTVFKGRILRVDVVGVETADGVKSEREIVRHPGAAVILAQLPDGRFVFVRQYRKAVELELLEVVAGTLESGEDPDACAARELHEETGYKAATLTKLGVAYPAPGYTAEKLHIYFAKLQPEQGGGTPDVDEHLDVVYLTAAEIERLISEGEMTDGKTLAAWLLYCRRILRKA